jgi:hypothetical protein
MVVVRLNEVVRWSRSWCICVGTVLYLCGHRSCGVTEGATGGRNSRVWGDVVGGVRGRIGSRASGSQEEAGRLFGSAVGLFVDVVEAASKQWWAQW